jgi:hypothetical protein
MAEVPCKDVIEFMARHFLQPQESARAAEIFEDLAKKRGFAAISSGQRL